MSALGSWDGGGGQQQQQQLRRCVLTCGCLAATCISGSAAATSRAALRREEGMALLSNWPALLVYVITPRVNHDAILITCTRCP